MVISIALLIAIFLTLVLGNERLSDKLILIVKATIFIIMLNVVVCAYGINDNCL